jgi:hypothetical protein
MKDDIIHHLDHPNYLEKLYRDNKPAFKREFNRIFSDISEHPAAKVWHERLNYEKEDIAWGTSMDLIFVIIAVFMAGLIGKIPEIANIDEDFFYSRNFTFAVFPFLTAWFAWKQQMPAKKLLGVASIFLISAVYMNILPDNPDSHTLILACIHLPLLLWVVLGFTFVGNEPGNYRRRLDFLSFNGDLVVMTTIILIAGALLGGVAYGLFTLIDIQLESFYAKYALIWGLPAAPIVGTYLVRTNPQLVNKVSPVIARIFTPLVLATLVIYLIAVTYTGKDPYNDREFLLVFNLLLVGVMAIILFSITETSKNTTSKTATLLLLVLSSLTIIVNMIALSAILFRITEWGITPNRLAVLGSNVLILVNLLMVTHGLYRVWRMGEETTKVENSIAMYLPVYAAWVMLVVFLFPVLFGFR